MANAIEKSSHPNRRLIVLMKILMMVVINERNENTAASTIKVVSRSGSSLEGLGVSIEESQKKGGTWWGRDYDGRSMFS